MKRHAIKGFIAGVISTALIGGFMTHINSRYDTLGACTALERGLTTTLVDSLRGDVRESLGTALPRSLEDMVFQPLTEPLVHERVKAYVGDRTWFGCAWGVLRLDVFDRAGLVAELRSLTLRF